MKFVLSAALLILAAQAAVAADYPTRSVEFVVPSSAGGGNDTTTRTLVEIIGKYDLVPVDIQVTNKSGGSTAVGMAYVKENASNDHLLLSVTSSILTTPLMNEVDIEYTDFTPIAMLASDRKVLVVNADSPYQTIDDLLKADASAITQGGGAVSTAEAIAGFKLEQFNGVDWTYVSFDGGAEGLTAVLGGHVTFAIPGVLEVRDHVRAGRLRVLATTATERLPEFPDAPTFAEIGVVGLPEAGRGIVGPSDMPAEVVAYWQNVIQQATEKEEWKKYLEDGDLNARLLPADQYAEWLGEQNEIYVELIPEMGI